ncbi:MAG: hypothetical protein WKF47_01605 [Geodermatophilaceae bacterium]
MAAAQLPGAVQGSAARDGRWRRCSPFSPSWRCRWSPQRVIDGPVARGETSGLWALGALAIAFGIGEAVFGFVRRWVQSFCMLDMETQHPQRPLRPPAAAAGRVPRPSADRSARDPRDERPRRRSGASSASASSS